MAKKRKKQDPLARVGIHLPDALNPVRQLRVMGRLVRRSLKRPGMAPGTLMHTGPKRVERTSLHLIRYHANDLEETALHDLDAAPAVLDERGSWAAGAAIEAEQAPVTWLDVQGLHEVEIVQAIGDRLGVHPLVLEDVVNTGQRPKFEEYDGHLFVVLRMLTTTDDTLEIQDEQVSLVVGPDYVITFQERSGDVFDPVRDRLRGEKGKIRMRGADYLAYALVDAIVDTYFGILEKIGDQTEELDLEIMERPEPGILNRIHTVKRELLVMRRAVWPLRDLVGGWTRSDSPVIRAGTRVFLRDVYDHAVQVVDTVETLRDLVGGMVDLYLSNLGHRQNEVMKVLTIMASVFIPLTFLAGIYGMNFDYMPELDEPWAYPTLLGLMGAAAVGMYFYFKRKEWL